MSATTVGPTQTNTTMPKGGWIPAARIWHGLVALVGTASFVASMWMAATNAGNGGAINGWVFSLSYFTVWSNILVFIMNWVLCARPNADGKYFRWFRLTTLVMITITGLVYAIVLAPLAHPTGLAAWTNFGYHYFVPWATVLGFLVFGPRPRFTAKLVPSMLIIPVIWLAYTLIRGLFNVTPPASPPDTVLGQPQHWYPYPFIDVGDPSPMIPGANPGGYGTVAINIVVIVILGLAFAYLFFGIDRWFSGGQRPTPLADISNYPPDVPPAAPAPNDVDNSQTGELPAQRDHQDHPKPEGTS